MSLIAATKQLQKDRTTLARQLERIDGALAALKGVSANGHGGRTKMKRKAAVGRAPYRHSEATKRKIAAAQRKRMAALRKKT